MVAGRELEGYEEPAGYSHCMSEPQLTIYTTAWCGDCRLARRVLDKHAIGYTLIDITDDAKARRYVEEINGGYRSVPTIVFPSSRVIVEPSAVELENALRGEGLLKAS
jgi:mycoredoxin